MKEKRKGFTLIEVLGVLLILAIIFSISFFIYKNFSSESKVIGNAITIESLTEAALNYVKEFKMNDRFWYDEINESGSSNMQFTCTTVKQLIDIGNIKNNPIDPLTGKKIDVNTTIKVLRDENKVLLSEITQNSNDCDKKPPSLKITFTGDIIDDWYTGDVKYKIEPITGISGISKYDYYMVNSSGSKVALDSGTDYKVFEGNILDSGENIKICGQVKNGNDLESGEICESINVDNIVPSAPTLVASDNKNTGSWHNKEFNLNISGGGNPPSGKYYVYSIDGEENPQKLSDSTIKVVKNMHNKEVYVKTCSNVGICSSSTKYKVLMDFDKPVITNVTTSTNSYVASLNVKADANDALSGIAKYKVTTSSSYQSNGWTTNSSGSNSVSINSSVNSNGTYYVWVEDKAGNYSSSPITIKNIATLKTVSFDLKSYDSSTISGSKTISGILAVESVTVNKGKVSNYTLNNNTLNVSVTGGSYDIEYESNYVYEPADREYADFDYVCDRYYCPDGGRVSGSRCVADRGTTYSFNTRYNVTCKCNNGSGWVPSSDWGAASCDPGYSTSYWDADNNCNSVCPPTGSKDVSGILSGYAVCKWNGNYPADCLNETKEYYCSRGELDGRYCYYCTNGTYMSSSNNCRIKEYEEIMYWQYRVTVKYYS